MYMCLESHLANHSCIKCLDYAIEHGIDYNSALFDCFCNTVHREWYIRDFESLHDKHVVC